jgi:hypothetical protein
MFYIYRMYLKFHMYVYSVAIRMWNVLYGISFDMSFMVSPLIHLLNNIIFEMVIGSGKCFVTFHITSASTVLLSH